MKVRVGTSGYAFKEWKGAFYPEDLKDDAMLGYYAGHFATVEINNTFYRLPKTHVLEEWAEAVPEDFVFAIKASQRITHHARLKEEGRSALEFLLGNLDVMGTRLGAVLFQCPPNLKKDLPRLQHFLGMLPTGRRYALEFRHDSWFSDDIVEELRARDVALVTSDSEEFTCPMIPTASWGYLRLHRYDYDGAALATWAARVMDEPWTDALVYFKHDAAPFSGPPAVRVFLDAVARTV